MMRICVEVTLEIAFWPIMAVHVDEGHIPHTSVNVTIGCGQLSVEY